MPDPFFRFVGIDLQHDPQAAGRLRHTSRSNYNYRNSVADVVRGDVFAVAVDMLRVGRRAQLVDGLLRVVLRDGGVVRIQVQVRELFREILLHEFQHFAVVRKIEGRRFVARVDAPDGGMVFERRGAFFIGAPR